MFGMVLAGIVGLLLVFEMSDSLKDLLDKGAETRDVASYLLIKLPAFLAMVIPIVVLVSLLYTLGVLHRNNEVTALRAAGLGRFRITRSIWVVGVLCCGAVFALNASIVPWSVEESRKLMESIDFRHQVKKGNKNDQIGVTRLVTFDNQREGRMWFINRYSRFLGRAYGVTVSEVDKSRREKLRLEAREATFDTTRRCWIFFEGRELLFDPETQTVTPSHFTEKVVPYFTEDPALMLVFDVKPSHLSFYELRRIIEYFDAEDNPKITAYAVRYFSLLAETLSPLVVIGLAIPFALTGVRVNPAVGVSKSLGLFLVYFLLVRFSNGLGSRGVVDPALAAAIPNGVICIAAAWFLARMK